MAGSWRKYATVCALLIFTAVFGWVFRPYPTIDPAKVHPALRGLDESAPCEWSSFADGGSLFVEVTKPDGSKVGFCVSNGLDQSFSERGQIYIGALHYADPAAVRIVGYEHTQYLVARWLAAGVVKPPNSTDLIPLLTKRTSDWIRLLLAEGPRETLEVLRLGR
ncbi:MAG TPA: hypothetical protein VFY13_01430 [Luteolibacter sp.]|nr:hypothetical protein [Luteolibacter sp.]